MIDAADSPSEPADDSPTPDPRPWPRYFARMLDTSILSMLVMIALLFPAVFIAPEAMDRLLAMLDTGIGGSILSNVLGLALAPLPTALLIARGQTPGKWLFGIRVRDADGRRLRVGMALKRELMVWVRGVGLGVPVVSLFALVTSHAALTDDGDTPWDKALGCRVEHAPRTVLWWVRAVLGAGVVFGMLVYSAIGMIAP